MDNVTFRHAKLQRCVENHVSLNKFAEQIWIDYSPFTIGRRATNDFILEGCQEASRKHATIVTDFLNKKIYITVCKPSTYQKRKLCKTLNCGMVDP